MRQATVITYTEFEDMVKTHLGLPSNYNFLAGEECGNDTAKTYSAYPAYDEEYVEEAKAGKWEFKAYVLVDALCDRGIIPPGTLVIEVSW